MDPETNHRFQQDARAQARRDVLMIAFLRAIIDEPHTSNEVRSAAQQLIWELE